MVELCKSRFTRLHHFSFHQSRSVFGILRDENVRGSAREQHVTSRIFLRSEARGVTVAIDPLSLLVIDNDVGDAVTGCIGRAKLGKLRISLPTRRLLGGTRARKGRGLGKRESTASEEKDSSYHVRRNMASSFV